MQNCSKAGQATQGNIAQATSLDVEDEISLCSAKRCRISGNRPFHRYGGHIELIRFKEYYRMPRGHEHISFVFRALFGTFFRKVFLELDCNGRKDPCAAFGCNNDRLFPEKYTFLILIYIPNTKLENGDHYYLQIRHNDLFAHYNLILRKL